MNRPISIKLPWYVERPDGREFNVTVSASVDLEHDANCVTLEGVLDKSGHDCRADVADVLDEIEEECIEKAKSYCAAMAEDAAERDNDLRRLDE